MTKFERIKKMDIDEMALVIGCPNDFDEGFEVPEGCLTYHPTTQTPLPCIKCMKNYLESEVEEK